jgi:hypothetical protein
MKGTMLGWEGVEYREEMIGGTVRTEGVSQW